eukprot:1856511-Pyramimonas_sp.AAC.1
MQNERWDGIGRTLQCPRWGRASPGGEGGRVPSSGWKYTWRQLCVAIDAGRAEWCRIPGAMCVVTSMWRTQC